MTERSMTASEVIEILDLIEGNGVEVWVHGGWGVDALLGEQTRTHDDLDVIVRVDDVAEMRRVLAEFSFELCEGLPRANFVLRDQGSCQIDVHPVRFDEDGNGIYRLANGENWAFPAPGFIGTGRIAGRQIKCLTADVEMLCHSTGYEPGQTDFHDMGLLIDRLGTAPVAPFS